MYVCDFIYIFCVLGFPKVLAVKRRPKDTLFWFQLTTIKHDRIISLCYDRIIVQLFHHQQLAQDRIATNLLLKL